MTLPTSYPEGGSVPASIFNQAFAKINQLDANKASRPFGADAVGVSWYPPHAYRANNYYFSNTSGLLATSGGLGIGTMRATPWVVVAAVHVIRLFVEHTIAGDTGSTIRLGVYASDGFGRPAALLLDAGTIPTSGTPGVQELTVDLTLQPGLYFTAAALQGGTVAPTMRTITTAPNQSPHGTVLPSASNAGIFFRTGFPGALPNPWGAYAMTGGNTARVGFKVAP